VEEGEAPTPRAKILNLQILRFVAASGVLLSHAADVTDVRDPWLWDVPWTAGVDIFFVISGFIMTILTANRFGRGGAARHFLVRRIIRIVPIYWLVTALMIATVLLLPGHVRSSQVDPGSVVTSFLFVPWARPDGQVVPILSQGWTLNYEAFFYLAFATALLHRRGLALLVVGFLALAALHAFVPGRLVALAFWTDPIILEFVAGIGLARLWLGGLRLGLAARLALAAAGILLFLGAGSLGLHRAIIFGIPAALLGAAFMFGEEPEKPGLIRRALVAGGDASYALYLSHTFTINAVVLAFGSRGWPAMAAAVAAAIVASLLVPRWIERPVLDRLHQRFAR
jgi:peptidoglycan/LPS O-acetylase OafA/YrhL